MRRPLLPVAFLVLLAAGPAAAAPFRVTLESNAVVASGVTASGKVVLLGVTREIGEDDYPTLRRHLEVLTDEDGDGVVRYNVDEGVLSRSLWAVTDLTSGDFDHISPEATGLRRVNWRGRGLERRADGKDSVEDQRRVLELVVVRPQVGAWSLRVHDGAESDGDGAVDGRLAGILESMEPLGESPAPPAVFQRDDVVLGLDPFGLELTLIKVPAGQ